MKRVRLNVVGSCVLAVGLSGCMTYTDPATGRTVLSTPSIGQLLGVRTASGSGATAVAYGPGAPSLHYEQVLGDTTHKLTLTRQSPTTWLVRVQVDSPSGFGDVQAIAMQTAPGKLKTERATTGDECRLAITVDPRTATVFEKSCFSEHGAAVEFSSTLTRVS